jgi:hypothetical protein
MAKNTKKLKESKASENQEVPPFMVYGSESKASRNEIRASSPVRRNVAADIERTDRFINIDRGLIPFRYSASVQNLATLDVRDAVILCQKAYYNVGIFRNTIDLMTEFSSSSIYLTGGSQKSREFFEAYFRKINLASFQDQFFREYYRSGNVFIYRFDTELTPEDATRITQVFGNKLKNSFSQSESFKIPARYSIINPADVYFGGTINFSVGYYYKLVTDYELERLRNPKTPEDFEVFESLPPQVKDQIKENGYGCY